MIVVGPFQLNYCILSCSIHELNEVSVFLFLQSVRVPLVGTPTFQHIGGSPPQHAIIADLAKYMFCLLLLGH